MIGIRSVKEIGQSNTCSFCRQAHGELRVESDEQSAKSGTKSLLRTFKDNESIGGGVSRNFAETRRE